MFESASIVPLTDSSVLLKKPNRVNTQPCRAAADANRVGQVNPLGKRKRPLLLSRHTAASDTQRLGVPRCLIRTAAASGET